ncbi:MAG: carbohydrate ABC transporter permease [Lautropia sp.]|nr:carbohydrate ABC transporter permease [Lautropia sp.]
MSALAGVRVPVGWRLFKALVVALAVAWSLGPIVLMVLASLRPPRDIFDPAAAWRFTPSLDSYRALFAQWPDFFAGMANSGIVTLFTTALAVLASALAGYAYSRLRTRAMSLSALSLVSLRLIPPIVTTLPLFPIVNWLRLNDTHLILILLYATFFVSLGTMVMRTFMDQIPVEIDEAALVDGASHAQLIGRIMLPLAAQGMVAVAVFVMVFAWNEFLFAFIFTTKAAKTAPLVLAEMTGAVDGVDWGVLFAAASLHLLPVLAFVVLAQRHLVEGLTAGATKG